MESPILNRLLPALATELRLHLREVEDAARRTLDSEGINYTNSTANGLYHEADVAGTNVLGAVGSRGRGALFAENGRRAGKMPPDAPIRAWLRDKKGVPVGRELDRATYLLRRKIGRRGVRGSRFLSRAFDGLRPQLVPRLAVAADRALEGVNLSQPTQ